MTSDFPRGCSDMFLTLLRWCTTSVRNNPDCLISCTMCIPSDQEWKGIATNASKLGGSGGWNFYSESGFLWHLSRWVIRTCLQLRSRTNTQLVQYCLWLDFCVPFFLDLSVFSVKSPVFPLQTAASTPDCWRLAGRGRVAADAALRWKAEVVSRNGIRHGKWQGE